MNFVVRTLLAVSGLLVSGAALAHPGPHPDGAFATGFLHPFIGLDHLLAMVCVGLWAVQLGGRWRVVVPAAFVTSMTLGALAGAIGFSLPLVEGGIAMSVLASGLLVAISARPAWYWAVGSVSAFAVFHGYAHGAEMPALQSQGLYFLGFAGATALLHALGVTIGIAIAQRPGVIRAAGAAIGLAGAWMMFSA